jgi:hypothetical protein
MTSQNPTEKDPKSLTTPPSDAAAKDAEPSESKRELTDEEIAAVAGGVSNSSLTGPGGNRALPPTGA